MHRVADRVAALSLRQAAAVGGTPMVGVARSFLAQAAPPARMAVVPMVVGRVPVAAATAAEDMAKGMANKLTKRKIELEEPLCE